MSYKGFGCALATCISVLVIGGELIPMEIVSLLTLGSIVSLIGMWYCYDRHVQDKAQHELNMKLRRTRR